jgi:hypothetical protein
VATEEASLADPALLQFVERLIDKGALPALIMIGLFALIWRFGWPKFGDHPSPPPQPNAVVEALTKLQAEVEEGRDAMHRLESKVDILLDRGNRK